MSGAHPRERLLSTGASGPALSGPLAPLRILGVTKGPIGWLTRALHRLQVAVDHRVAVDVGNPHDHLGSVVFGFLLREGPSLLQVPAQIATFAQIEQQIPTTTNIVSRCTSTSAT
jgi:hypothetical protein